MPLYANALALIRKNLEAIARGEKPPMIAIGTLTTEQLTAINRNRANARTPAPPIEPEIVLIGRHLYQSRVVKDGYTIKEVLFQISNALGPEAAYVRTLRATLIQDRRGRSNQFGERIHDEVVLECSAKYPRPELLSVIPKGELSPNARRAAAVAAAPPEE